MQNGEELKKTFSPKSERRRSRYMPRTKKETAKETVKETVKQVADTATANEIETK